MKRQEIPQILNEKISMVEPYPATVVPVPEILPFTAFYPGGPGLWQCDNENHLPHILVLGQDFSSIKDFNDIKERGKPDLNSPTWRNLEILLKKVGINMTDCFFSNVFMGLRKEGSITGNFPGGKDKEFVKRNVEFLKFQIQLLKPSIIITLGTPAARMLARTSEDLKAWLPNKSFSYFDLNNTSVLHDIKIESLTCKCIKLIHPSFRNVNVGKRTYKTFIGDEAEVTMLKEVMES